MHSDDQDDNPARGIVIGLLIMLTILSAAELLMYLARHGYFG